MGEKTCKVFTPLEIVNHMLDKIGYINHLYGKKILENSCGTGRFLCEIVRRYITNSREDGKPDDVIKSGLEKDIKGIEKEPDVYDICKRNLDIVALELGIQDVKWNLQLGDALKLECESIYQYVVGNPPYITYYNLPKEDRELIRTEYVVCKKGKADYYYAFIEASLRALAEGGKMIYLIPNNFMKNQYSEDLRKYMLPYLEELEDFKFKKIFENRQTSSAIVLCSKKKKKDTFIYVDSETQEFHNIYKDMLCGKWNLNALSVQSTGRKKFNECFKVSAPVATLLNEAFIIKDFQENEYWIEKDGFKLEKEGLRPAASPKSLQYKENNYIIFPYYYYNGICCRYTEDEFTKKFPQITAYLQQFADQLSKRNVDKNGKWFEYGRSQALAHICQKKLMLSTLITGSVKYYCLNEETIPYSGMYIVPKENYMIEQAEQILSSSDFIEYIKSIGIHANGKTYRISPRDVGNYSFEEKW